MRHRAEGRRSSPDHWDTDVEIDLIVAQGCAECQPRAPILRSQPPAATPPDARAVVLEQARRIARTIAAATIISVYSKACGAEETMQVPAMAIGPVHP